MLNNFRNKVIAFLQGDKDFPVFAAIAAGLYPLLYYYNSNFTLINSWSQFFFFLLFYIIIPALVFYFSLLILRQLSSFKKITPYVLPVLNLSLFTFLIVISTYGFNTNVIIIATLSAILIGVLLRNHLKKIMVFQFLLSVLVFAKLIPDLYKHMTYSSAWMQQPDNIESVVLKKRPNVYIIQPDGYANFSELKNSPYSFDNSAFNTYLEDKKFKLYSDFRSNYNSTLSSNSSMFAMQHHYFNTPKPGVNELYNARDIIVGENPVIDIFNKNNYKTSLIIETPYLLVNKPQIAFNYCNIGLDEVAYMANTKRKKRDIFNQLKVAIKENTNSNNFYFIEKLSPGHVSTFKSGSSGKTNERLKYLKDLKDTNTWLTKTIDYITRNDANSLIVVVADHGGFVGLEYALQSKSKELNTDLVKTIFTSTLAIRWPDKAPVFDNKLKTNVNLFRVLFSYLGENEEYLKHLQEDKSYTIIEKNAPFGVYERINENGEVVFNKY